MTDHFEARVIKAISETMTCDKCPHPCIAKQNSSMYNCAKQWGYILSQIDIKSNLKEILDEVYTIWNREHNPVIHCADNIAYEEKTHD